LEPLTDLEVYRRCLYWEASGEGYAGMFAVACVIWKRHITWRQTVQQVILGPNQFSSMTNGGKPVPGDHEADEATLIANSFLAGTQEKDVTNGALYYANLKTADSGWFSDNIVNNVSQHPVTAKIGAHTFFA
jgi:spore germination cell wall hydrolase CwlJ-like protein